MGRGIKLVDFDWHGGEITSRTRITRSYRNTQNVRRYFHRECGDDFKFDRSFMAWMKAAENQTMGAAAKEWLRRKKERSSTV